MQNKQREESFSDRHSGKLALIFLIIIVGFMTHVALSNQQKKREQCEAIPGHVYVVGRNTDYCVEGKRVQ